MKTKFGLKILFFCFFGILNNAVPAFAILTTTVSPPSFEIKRAQCERLLSFTEDKSGKLTDISFKQRTDEELHVEAQKIIAGLKARLQEDPFSNKSWISFDHFLDFSESVFKVIRTVGGTFSGSSDGTSAKALQNAETLLFGANSIGVKIQDLHTLLGSKSLFTSKANRLKQIDELADVIESCRTAIAACKVELPDVMRDLNHEYILLNKTKTLVSQEMALLESLKNASSDAFGGQDAKEINDLMDKKILDLSMGLTSTQLLLDETEKLISSVKKAYLEAAAVNEATLQKLVITAAQENINIRRVLDLPESRQNTSSPFAGSSKQISDIVSMRNLTDDVVLSKILEIVSKSDTMSPLELISLMGWINSRQSTRVTKDEKRDAEVTTFRNKNDLDISPSYKLQISVRTLIVEAALRKVKPDKSISKTHWFHQFESYWLNISDFDYDSDNKWAKPIIAQAISRLSNRIYDQLPD